MASPTEVARLIGELKDVIANTRGLLHATTDSLEGGADAARAQAQLSLRKANRLLRRSRRLVNDRGRIAALVTDRYVRTSPWKAIGIAAGVAFALGWLVTRRDRN